MGPWSMEMPRGSVDALVACRVHGGHTWRMQPAFILTRRRVPELMDDEGIGPREHDAALRGLARLNRVSRSDAILWPVLRRVAASGNGRVLRVMDVATGSGDVPAALDARARSAGIRIEWTLCDRSPHALARAEERAAGSGMNVRTVCVDVLAAPLPTDCDVVISSLFLHHFDPHDAVRILRSMRDAARVAVGVADLDRTWLGLGLATLGARVLSRSPVVHFDAAASVRAAHARAEIESLARDAGMSGCVITRAWPERWRLWWNRDGKGSAR
jgi:SAM-dependent methyltransferase